MRKKEMLNIIYQDSNLLVVDKPAGIPVYPVNQKTPAFRTGINGVYSEQGKSVITMVLEKFPELKKVGKKPRYGIVHRLDQETSGILLIAKTNKALNFLQNQFKQRKVVKKYLALVQGKIERERTIKTLIGRDPKNRTNQKAYLPHSPQAKRKGLRKAITRIKPLKTLKDFTLIEAIPKTGRKHQIRTHLKFIGHPVAGDKVYNFKNQSPPKGLKRHFLHASYLKIKLMNNKKKEFKSPLPKDLKEIIKKL